MATKRHRGTTKFEVLEVLPAHAVVVPLSSARAHEPYLRLDGNGLSAGPRIVYPAVSKDGAPPWELNISVLAPLTNLCRPFAEAIIQGYGATPNHTTLRGITRALGTGLVTFLVDSDLRHIGLGDITKSLLDAFMCWLDQREVWSESARPRLYSLPALLLRRLRTMEPWRTMFDPALYIPPGHWMGADRRSKPVNVINRDLMTRIRRAAITEVVQTMQDFAEAERICEKYREILIPLASLPPMKKGPKSRDEQGGWSMELFVAYANQTSNGGPVLSANRISEQHANGSALARAMKRRKVKMANDIAPRFHATSRAVVPFVLLMTIALAYNPDTIRQSKVGDYYYEDELGAFFVANAYKGRSAARQPVYIPVDEEPDNPSVLFQFLLRWTARLRRSAAQQWRDRLFIFTGTDDLAVTTFHAGNSSAWKRQFEQFRLSHGLEHFTLEMIRKTVLDLAYEIFDGDIKAVQIQASHRSVETTEIYSSEGERQRRYEKLGSVMAQRQRHRETNGLIDQRGRGEREDLNCATPGWNCSDPYDSPFFERGKLCAKYGWCPICPLSMIELSSPLAFAYAIGLLDATNRAQSAMSPEAWIRRIGPIKKKLEEYRLGLFSPDVVEAARAIHIPVMPMPE